MPFYSIIHIYIRLLHIYTIDSPSNASIVDLFALSSDTAVNFSTDQNAETNHSLYLRIRAHSLDLL